MECEALANKGMHLTVGALATHTAPPAGDAQRSPDDRDAA
jgi:hypothetical protein